MVTMGVAPLSSLIIEQDGGNEGTRAPPQVHLFPSIPAQTVLTQAAVISAWTPALAAFPTISCPVAPVRSGERTSDSHCQGMAVTCRPFTVAARCPLMCLAPRLPALPPLHPAILTPHGLCTCCSLCPEWLSPTSAGIAPPAPLFSVPTSAPQTEAFPPTPMNATPSSLSGPSLGSIFSEHVLGTETIGLCACASPVSALE